MESPTFSSVSNNKRVKLIIVDSEHYGSSEVNACFYVYRSMVKTIKSSPATRIYLVTTMLELFFQFLDKCLSLFLFLRFCPNPSFYFLLPLCSASVCFCWTQMLGWTLNLEIGTSIKILPELFILLNCNFRFRC